MRRRTDGPRQHRRPPDEMIEVHRRTPSNQPIKILGEQQCLLYSLPSARGAAEIIRIAVRCVVVRMHNLFPEDGFDVDGAECKVIKDFRVVKELMTVIAIVPIVGAYSCKVECAAIVQVEVVNT